MRKQTGIAFALKIVMAFVAFGYNWLLSRLLGADGLGAFQIALTITMLASVVASLGLNNAVLRLVSANIAVADYEVVKGFYRRCIVFVGLASLLLTITIQLFTKPLFSHFFPEKENLVSLIILMSWAVIPTAMNNLIGELLNAFGKFQISLFVQSGFSFIFAALGLLFSWLLIGEVTSSKAVLIFIVSLWLTLILSIYFFNKNMPTILRGVKNIRYNDKELFNSAMPLWTVTIAWTAIEHLDILLIGIWVGIKEAGIYAIAKKVAGLNSYLLVSTNTVVAPQFASLYAQNKIEELKNIAQRATKTLFWSGLAALCFFTILSKPILGLFGDVFTAGWLLLIILSLGQFINVATGSVGYLLIMTGHEALFRTNMIVSSVLTILLFLILIPIFSTLGAAIASALGMVFQNSRAAWLVEKKLGFYTLNLRYGQ